MSVCLIHTVVKTESITLVLFLFPTEFKTMSANIPVQEFHKMVGQ